MLWDYGISQSVMLHVCFGYVEVVCCVACAHWDQCVGSGASLEGRDVYGSLAVREVIRFDSRIVMHGTGGRAGWRLHDAFSFLLLSHGLAYSLTQTT